MQDILSQISLGESQTTEFKLSFQKEVIVSVVAFANAKGGKIFIGVSGRCYIKKRDFTRLDKSNQNEYLSIGYSWYIWRVYW